MRAHLANISRLAPERIERYFEDYKSQINNRLAGIGQPKREEER